MGASRAIPLLCLLILIAGCASAHVDAPLTRTLSGNQPNQRADFWLALARRPVICNDEAFHALLLFKEGQDPADTYDRRVALLKERHWLLADFAAPADDSLRRGDFAVALVRILDYKDSLNIRLFGATPRYATRAMESAEIYPSGSPHQTFSGAEFCGIIGKVEDQLVGDTTYLPARQLDPAAPPPADTGHASAFEPIPGADWLDRPLLLSLYQPTGQPATSPAISAIITNVRGQEAFVSLGGKEPRQPARKGMALTAETIITTGSRSGVTIYVTPGPIIISVDRLTIATLAELARGDKNARVQVLTEQGRGRAEINTSAADYSPTPTATAPSAPAALDASFDFRGPHASMAPRSTRITFSDQPPYPPLAVSLTGQAVFETIHRRKVALGGAGLAVVEGDQAGSAESSLASATLASQHELARTDFENKEISLVVTRGGFVRGDVLVGDSRVTDAQLQSLLPGTLNFVLRWNGGPDQELNDLNLAVFSPRHDGRDVSTYDFVANPPFTISLLGEGGFPGGDKLLLDARINPPTPADPGSSQALRECRVGINACYPKTSRSGGRIGLNHVGPFGLEIASWPKDYPPGPYFVAVYDLLDVNPKPAPELPSVPFTIDVYLNGRQYIVQQPGTAQNLHVSQVICVPVGVPDSACFTHRGSAPAKLARRPINR